MLGYMEGAGVISLYYMKNTEESKGRLRIKQAKMESTLKMVQIPDKGELRLSSWNCVGRSSEAWGGGEEGPVIGTQRTIVF